MFKLIGSFIGGLFSTSKLQDTAIDGLRKLGGLDEMNSQDKAKYLLDYMNATKHQSPTRRLIAIALTGLYVLVGVLWVGAAICGYAIGIDGCAMLAVNTKMFFVEVVLTPFNLVLSFYFVTHIAGKVGGK